MGCCDASKAGGGREGVVDSTDQISDALSDHFGWLVNDYEWINESCN